MLALFLSSIGLYGVVAYWVAQSTREIGIRTALGALRGDILKLVLGRGLRLVLPGIALGLIGAVALSRLISGLLFEVSAYDPAVFTGLAGMLVLVAVIAAVIPARRATRVEPTEALRYE